MASTGKPRPKRRNNSVLRSIRLCTWKSRKRRRKKHRKRNEFARLIFEWGFAEFKKAGSFDALIGRKTTIKK